jgi:hypothetical protein
MMKPHNFDRWHLQPEDLVVIDTVPVTDKQKEDVERWIRSISSPTE